jgi:hypothetical protein
MICIFSTSRFIWNPDNVNFRRYNYVVSRIKLFCVEGAFSGTLGSFLKTFSEWRKLWNI